MRARHWLVLTAVLITTGSAARATLPTSATGAAQLVTPAPGMPGEPYLLVLAGDSTDGGPVDAGPLYPDGGDGYPDGLRGQEIPEIVRAMCVVDSYDAMSFQRPYRRALDAGACLEELRRC